jgi:CHAD domain-containing protein
MAYSLKRDESVTHGLKRVVSDEMESAGTQLSGDQKTGRDKAIHEARKSIKKVRALVRLVSADLGDTCARENVRLRDVARRLSEFRDAFAIIATFDDLTDKYKDEARNKLRTVRAGLAKRRNEAGREEDVAFVLNEAARSLRNAAKRV